MRFDQHFVTEALSNVSILHAMFPKDPHFSVDSRTLQPGEIFVALVGERVDGHMYLEQAFERGAAGCIIAYDQQHILNLFSVSVLSQKLVIVVPDTRQALIKLASFWRNSFTYPVVGLTGSIGKTSTKEILAHIMRCAGKRVLASYGNQNTVIGASINIFRMRPEHEVAIFEMGISKRGEMAELACLVKPTTAIITCIGHQHMDGLGSLHDIALEKRDIFKYFKEENIGVVNGDQAILSHVAYAHPVVRFGSKTTNQIQARKISIEASKVKFILKLYKNKYPICINRPHMGAIFNAVGAAAVAYLLGVEEAVIVRAIQDDIQVPGRFESRVLHAGNGMLINDCYNANPESMKAALLAFQNIETSAQKIAVLGDMLGLGANSPFWHRQLGRFLRKVPTLKHIILVGDLVQWTKETAPADCVVEKVATWELAVSLLNKRLGRDSLVLVKGSNGVGLGNLVQTVSVPKSQPATTAL